MVEMTDSSSAIRVCASVSLEKSARQRLCSFSLLFHSSSIVFCEVVSCFGVVVGDQDFLDDMTCDARGASSSATELQVCVGLIAGLFRCWHHDATAGMTLGSLVAGDRVRVVHRHDRRHRLRRARRKQQCIGAASQARGLDRSRSTRTLLLPSNF